MLPSDLKTEQFAQYPPLGRQLAIAHLALLRALPLALAPLLLQEVSTYDWKFPAERQDIDGQLAYLGSLTAAQLRAAMAQFAAIQVTPLPAVDWVSYPKVFSAQLSAILWATGQIDQFRAASIGYVDACRRFRPPALPPPSRLTMVIVGQGVARPPSRSSASCGLTASIFPPSSHPRLCRPSRQCSPRAPATIRFPMGTGMWMAESPLSFHRLLSLRCRMRG